MKIIQRKAVFSPIFGSVLETFEAFPSKNVKGGHGHIEPYYIIIYSNIFI